jgi:hypothetical protein
VRAARHWSGVGIVEPAASPATLAIASVTAFAAAWSVVADVLEAVAVGAFGVALLGAVLLERTLS